MTGTPVSTDLQAVFQKASASRPSRKRKRQAPFSLRLTSEERTRLEQDAGETPLATYIKFRLFNNVPELTRPRSIARRPNAETQLIAKLLAALGSARLANNLNQLAKAANTGSLPVTPETETELREACEAVQAMRCDLVSALGLRTESRS